MYLPPQFQAKDPAHAVQLMREHPLASLISNDDDGFPFLTHLPLHLEQRGEQLVLLGHVARPNPHWRYLRDRPCALVSFLGPHAYMSPKVYPDLARVPSWSYVTVQARVQARLIDAPDDKDGLLKTLINDHEPPYADQWRSLEADYTHKMLGGMVGFELEVLNLACKLKLNQHRPESHAALKTHYAQGTPMEQELALWMDRLGLGPSRE